MDMRTARTAGAAEQRDRLSLRNDITLVDQVLFVVAIQRAVAVGVAQLDDVAVTGSPLGPDHDAGRYGNDLGTAFTREIDAAMI